jgi:hypothetical protein
MCKRRKVIVLVGLSLLVVVAVFSMRERVRPIGGLSRRDVIEIREVATRSRTPRWSWFTPAKISVWRYWIWEKLSFRIVDISEVSDDRVAVRYREDGWPEAAGFLIERKNGRWVSALDANRARLVTDMLEANYKLLRNPKLSANERVLTQHRIDVAKCISVGAWAPGSQ